MFLGILHNIIKRIFVGRSPYDHSDHIEASHDVSKSLIFLKPFLEFDTHKITWTWFCRCSDFHRICTRMKLHFDLCLENSLNLCFSTTMQFSELLLWGTCMWVLVEGNLDGFCIIVLDIRNAGDSEQLATKWAECAWRKHHASEVNRWCHGIDEIRSEEQSSWINKSKRPE